MSAQPRQSAWLSRGFEELVWRLARKDDPDSCDYDVVIVGSGYGGAMAAAQFAGARDGTGGKVKVCVLERGKEYLPGMFPSRMADLAGHVRFSTSGSTKPKGRREGLFDVRVGPDVCAMVANGLGGGSLINAGVMEVPSDEVFEDWPDVGSALKNGGYYERAKAMLGAADASGDNTLVRHPRGTVDKREALRRLAGGAAFRDAAVTIAMTDKSNFAGVERRGCQLCGDCATGCNHEAKDSLDTNLLVIAWSHGAEIFTGATVLRVLREESDGLWVLEVVHTDAHLRKRQGGSEKLRARKVVLAAGTFGSTEILLRSDGEHLKLSRRLGERFSANGDTIATVYGESSRVNAAADETVAFAERAVGPTITGIVDLRATNDCLVEDLAIPGPLGRAFEEVVSTVQLLHQLADADWSKHTPGSPSHDPCAVSAEALARTSVLAIMSRDSAEGRLQLVEDPKPDRTDPALGDGAVCVRWPELRNAELYKRQHELLEQLARNAGRKARVLANPLWQLLPSNMQFLLENRHGPAFTVHPLGGCALGPSADEAVVDEFGRVYKRATEKGATELWPGLAVLDGAVVPSSLGTNPALTIAAFALRAAEALRDEWGYSAPPQWATRRLIRPIFAAPRAAVPPRGTQVEVMERMSGEVRLAGRSGSPVDCIVELTLKFKPVGLADLILPKGGQGVTMRRELVVREGQLRVFRRAQWTERRRQLASDEDFDAIALLKAPVHGSLTLLHRERSWAPVRIARGLWGYALNRGLRDTWQYFVAPKTENGSGGRSKAAEALDRLVKAFRLASRAGEVRLLEYRLQTELPDGIAELALPGGRASIHGKKRLTYGRRSNPWRQLMRLELLEFPGLQKRGEVLELDLRYLAHEGVPLLRLVGQQDQPSALADLASFAAYFTRLLLNVHVWSFRKPDAAPERKPQRLPGIVPGLPAPEIREIDSGERLRDGTPVRIRLTRYRPGRTSHPPVLLIHGYSASGTTFAHPAVRPNLAEHLCKRQHDVWIVDLRTSSGMPTARHPWQYEEAALGDLPKAIDTVCEATGEPRVNVVAHCMGAAMFSMAVLKCEPARFASRIGRTVLSQVGPWVVFTPVNVFRGYVMSYLRHFLPMDDYDFTVPPDPSVAQQLLDRLLATLPYPEEEFDIENPKRPWKRTPFVGFRHRMDALYGRDFSLAGKDGTQRIDDRALEHVDELFGPLSLETVSQGIQFARFHALADPRGKLYYSRPKAKERWTFPTLSIHGEENGLMDVATLTQMERYLAQDAGLCFEQTAFPSFGHQDSLIGKDAEKVFAVISAFLERS